MKAETSIWIWSEIAMAPGHGRKRIAKERSPVNGDEKKVTLRKHHHCRLISLSSHGERQRHSTILVMKVQSESCWLEETGRKDSLSLVRYGLRRAKMYIDAWRLRETAIMPIEQRFCLN